MPEDKKVPELPKEWEAVARLAVYVEMTIEKLLGSVPPKDDLEYVKQYYMREFGVSAEEAEEIMDVEAVPEPSATEKALMGEPLSFRRDVDGNIYIAEGQILGLLKAAVRGLGLSRKIKNIPQSFFTEPKRIRPVDPETGQEIKEPHRKIVRPVRTRYGPTLTVHECIDRCKLCFTLITTNRDVTKDLLEKLLFMMKQIGFNPGARHGYGQITELEWEWVKPKAK